MAGRHVGGSPWFQSPRGGFGFLKVGVGAGITVDQLDPFQSPRGDFGFLKQNVSFDLKHLAHHFPFQSPRGDFGFLKTTFYPRWTSATMFSFNPLAGILVF